MSQLQGRRYNIYYCPEWNFSEKNEWVLNHLEEGDLFRGILSALLRMMGIFENV